MSRRLPPLYALRAFEAAARHASFTRAAAELAITQSAVSRHIRTLEEHFGCRLFERSGRHLQLTETARGLLPGVREGFDALEKACATLRSEDACLRLKAPSTLTMRWLLDVLGTLREHHPTPRILASSVWMDIDGVDFHREPYDCAILLGNGHFGDDTECHLLFEEWLIPLCAPALVETARTDLAACELIHPSPDRRDWRRWLKGTGARPGLNLASGKVFDTLEQGNMAAISGHGISVGDLLLSQEAIANGLLALPFHQAVATTDGYYLVWPRHSARRKHIDSLRRWLTDAVPHNRLEHIEWVG